MAALKVFIKQEFQLFIITLAGNLQVNPSGSNPVAYTRCIVQYIKIHILHALAVAQPQIALNVITVNGFF